MKINEKLLQSISNGKIVIKNEEDKIKLSEYKDYIPMFDIYTFKIFYVAKEELFIKLNKNYYIFLDELFKKDLYYLIKRYYEKYKKTKDKNIRNQLKILLFKTNRMYSLLENYDIDILSNTSYKTLYENSEIDYVLDTNLEIYNPSLKVFYSFGTCRRNSFHPFIDYITPYYSKIELIKLGQNMNLFNKNDKEKLLLEDDVRYTCKEMNKNDVFFDEIKNHSNTILNNNTIADITFYSFIGASLLNRFLRETKDFIINKFYYDRLKNMISTMKKTPALEKDYHIYRFISDDKFLKKKKIGDIFSDNGFMSTTRNPFYSSGLNGTFGLILVKINLKKGIKGLGLFIEHFSLFSKEEEFLLPPNTKLKLVAKNNKFKYFHTNEDFEKRIDTKYELDFVKTDYNWFKKVKVINEPILELDNNFPNATNKYNQLIFNNLIFNVYYFDGDGAYNKFYYSNNKQDISLIHFDSYGYPLLVIELGEELVINYLNQFYFYNQRDELNEKSLIDTITKIGNIFKYNTAKIFDTFNNFGKFKSNYMPSQEIYLYMKLYNNRIYDYLKKGKKSKEITYDFKKLDSLFKKSIPKDLENFIDNIKFKSIKELFIYVVEKNFNKYKELSNYLKLNELNYGELVIDKKNKKINSIFNGELYEFSERLQNDENNEKIRKSIYNLDIDRIATD